MSKRTIVIASVLGATSVAVLALAAQTWPTRPVTMPVGYAEPAQNQDGKARTANPGYAGNPPARLIDVTAATRLEFAADLEPSSPDWAFAEATFPRTDDPMRRVSSLKIDLDADGKPETAYYITGTASCGTRNCDFRIYKKFPDGQRLILQAATSPVFFVLQTRTAGYADIAFPAGLPEESGPEKYTVWRWSQ